jgi:predicted Zn-dependent protease with MMP-like domain
MTTRAEQFDELVLDAVGRMEHHAGAALGSLEFAVEDVPPSDPAPWESPDVPLGRLFAAEGKVPARIVVYRRPVETRTTDARELAALINDVIVEQVASLLGIDPRDLDAGYDPDAS